MVEILTVTLQLSFVIRLKFYAHVYLAMYSNLMTHAKVSGLFYPVTLTYSVREMIP